MGRKTALGVLLLLVGMWSGGTGAAEKSGMTTACESAETMSGRRACGRLLDKGEPPEGSRFQALQQLIGARTRGVLPIAQERWVSIGPTAIIGGTLETTWMTLPRSGRVAAITVNPRNNDHWLVGAAGGGIWETLDAGNSWAPRTDTQPALTMGAIAFAPSRPNIVYAGTGEAVFATDAYGGMGILKSMDGGRTWTHLVESRDTFLNKGFSDLAVHPTNPDVVVAAVTKATRWQPPPNVTPKNGIYKSIDGGREWKLKLAGEGTDLEVDPRDFKRQYAGLGHNAGAAGVNGVYRSTSAADAWDPINGPWTSRGVIGRVELAISPTHPDVLYVGIHDASPTATGAAGGGILGLWKTSNAWDLQPTWQEISLRQTDDGNGKLGYCGWNPGVDPRAVPQCFYNHELLVDRQNPIVLYAGGIGLWRYDGTNWKELAFRVPERGIHADQHTMAWAGKRLIVGNDGGVYSSTDGGEHWTNHNPGLSTIQFWGGTVAPTPQLLVLGGTQDNGTAVWRPGTQTWTGITRGDAGPAAISPTHPETHWAIAAVARGLEIRRTVNAAATPMQLVGDNLPEAVRRGGGITRPFLQCPANHDVVLFGDKALWKTTNFFASSPNQPAWASNSDEIPAPADDPGRKLASLGFAPSDASCQTYAIAGKAWLRMTTDGGDELRSVHAIIRP